MRSHSVLALMLLILIGLSSCSPTSSFPPPIPSPDDGWNVTLTQTGGFAGVHLVIRVSSDGMLLAEDRRSGLVISRPTSKSLLQDLTRMIANGELPKGSPPPSVCADCFVYDLQIISNRGSLRIQTDDSNLKRSGAEELILFLVDARDRALSSGN